MHEKLLGVKGVGEKFIIALNRSFDNISDALEVLDSVNIIMNVAGCGSDEFCVFDKEKII